VWKVIQIILGNLSLSYVFIRIFSRNAYRELVRLKGEREKLLAEVEELRHLRAADLALFAGPSTQSSNNHGEYTICDDSEMYVVRDTPANPKGTFCVFGTPSRKVIVDLNKADVKDAYGESLKDREGRACPLVSVGDIFLGSGGYRVKVVELVFGDGHYASCDALRALKLIRGSDWNYYSPAVDIKGLDCAKQCPILNEMLL